jgi:hypothetical protein
MSDVPDIRLRVSSSPSPYRVDISPIQIHDDLECDEFYEPVEDSLERNMISLHNSSVHVLDQWKICHQKIKRLQRENLSKDLQIDRLEDEVEQIKDDLSTERAVMKIYTRSIKRMVDIIEKKGFMKDYQDDECFICSRPFMELALVNQIHPVILGCCQKKICTQCLLAWAHVSRSALPSCPFCKQKVF